MDGTSLIYNQNADKIRIATKKILSCGDAFGIMYEAVHEMYEVYASISGIGIQNQNRKFHSLPVFEITTIKTMPKVKKTLILPTIPSFHTRKEAENNIM